MTWNKEKKAHKLQGLFFLFGSNFIICFLLGVDKIIIIVHEFKTMESESPTLRPCLLKKAVPGREATLPAE